MDFKYTTRMFQYRLTAHQRILSRQCECELLNRINTLILNQAARETQQFWLKMKQTVQEGQHIQKVWLKLKQTVHEGQHTQKVCLKLEQTVQEGQHIQKLLKSVKTWWKKEQKLYAYVGDTVQTCPAAVQSDPSDFTHHYNQFIDRGKLRHMISGTGHFISDQSSILEI